MLKRTVVERCAPILRQWSPTPLLYTTNKRTYVVDFQPKITVIGVGGGGGNAVNHMISSNLTGVNFVACNTDAQALSQSLTPNRVRMWKETEDGLGAGSKPHLGRLAAENDINKIVELDSIKDSNLVFITAGMGGGTGTGAAPVIARGLKQKSSDILTVGVVTYPFDLEGRQRCRNAQQGIDELQQEVDTLIVIKNQNLVKVAEERGNTLSFQDAMHMADSVLYDGVRTITDLIVKPGLVNLDFSDLRTVLLSSRQDGRVGRSVIGTGTASGHGRATAAATRAVENKLIDNQSLQGARGVLINITGGSDLSLTEIQEAANVIQSQVHPDAVIIWGASSDEAKTGSISVSVVACGLGLDS